MRVVEHRTRAMASAVHALVVDPAAGAEALVERRLAELEDRWSRFRPDSDISRLNRAEGRPISIAPDTVTLLLTMLEAVRLTDGRFDPTILPVLLAGDDAPGAALDSDSGPRGRVAGLSGLELDHDAGTARLPVGVTVCPGGLGKGLAADLVAVELCRAGAAGALVGVGGDLAAVGRGPADGAWPIVIEVPDDPETPLLSFTCSGGGVATSAAGRPDHNGVVRPHLVDPATGRHAATDLAAVTVVAPCGWQAEAHATAALVTGGDDFAGYLAAHQLAGLAVDGAGAVVARVGLPEVLRVGAPLS